MKKIVHKAEDRGNAYHGWLQSYHSFSFANYYDPEKIHFGALRVLNDDTVAPGQGFGAHPHDNMEIISIPLSGDLEHQDNMGNKAIIKEGDVQVMSAGTGIMHSEYNRRDDKPVSFLQIWVIPNRQQVTPRYDQISIKELEKPNELFQILSPNKDDQGVWIYQDAWFYLGKFTESKTVNYQLKNSANGIYVFVLSGQLTISETVLKNRDAIGIWDTDQVEIAITANTHVLIMEVPMII